MLIVGASRGIGLELTRQYVAAGWETHATTRTPGTPGPLGSMPVTLHELEVRDPSHLAAVVADMSGAPIDVLLHVAGVYRGSTNDMLEINAEAPIRVAEALVENVALSNRRTIAILTSQLGARRGRTGSLGGYGDSKAALNDAFRARAASWSDRGVGAVVIHPGWVRTDMGGRSAPLSAAESARGIRALLAGLTPVMHGRFWTWDGREHPW